MAVKGPKIKQCCLAPSRLTDLQTLSDGLERCQKSLNDYLDPKRNAFPRFFLISDDELLSILGSSDPSCVQEHMIKGMVVLAANQVWWTWEVQDVFKKLKKGEKHALKNYAEKMHRQIDELVTRITQPLRRNDRRKINTVLIIDVHARDIVDSFVENRFYWLRKHDDLFVHQCSASFSYGYEYMGLNGRLVITPLTDRIYLTLTQVQETAVGKIFSGLAQCGAWGCFDEFNRIDASVLPVVVIVPDLQQICEIMLFSEGFLMAKDVVLMRALRDMNLPKFVFDDVPLFLGLISDLFPGLDCPRVRYPNFNDAVEQILEDNKYVIVPNQVFLLTHSFNC
ncbi:hypothetical protein XENOCAPTIV_017941 [Xenoophorus captivus]|uniref:Dynein heavy chain hydrolytic ATP-binding dynein motor region domain-containing protein n=1 Tax=Xenoophorus captivus TaxID=1517983 RepID=A0ABV0RJL9_9TELE